MVYLNEHFVGKVPSILLVTEEMFFKTHKNYTLWSCQNVCEAVKLSLFFLTMFI